MAVRIRLSRIGHAQAPVLSSGGRGFEMLRATGVSWTYLARTTRSVKPALIQLDEEKIISWINKGATPSDTAKQLMKKSGIRVNRRRRLRLPKTQVSEPVRHFHAEVDMKT